MNKSSLIREVVEQNPAEFSSRLDDAIRADFDLRSPSDSLMFHVATIIALAPLPSVDAGFRRARA
jgi:hypothetical protein